MKKLLKISLLLLCSQAKAQDFTCSNPVTRETITYAVPPCAPHSDAFHNKYKKKESYIPIDGSTSALSVHKTIKVNIIVVNPLVEPLPGDGSYDPIGQPVNYHEGDISLITAFMNKANDILMNNPVPSDPIIVDSRNPRITDTRFRLQVENIKFIRSDELAWVGDFGPGLITGYAEDPDHTLNILLTYTKTGNTPGGIALSTPRVPSLNESYAADYTNDLFSGENNGTPYIVIKNFWKNPAMRSGTGSAEKCANVVLHELGHTLGLQHTYHLDYGVPRGALEIGYTTAQESENDYLADVFGNFGAFYAKTHPRPVDNTGCGTLAAATANSYDGCTNNCMGGNTFGNYRSPMQIGRMHRNAYFLNCRNFIYNTYPADETQPDPYYGQGQQYPLNVSTNETWDFDIKMYNDIRVKANATLTITCKVRMPHYSNIIVEPGGKLVIDGGTITSDLPNDLWRGIMVQGVSTANQDGGAQGVVEMVHGATIENALEGIVAGDDRVNDYSKSGGIVKISNAVFHNNVRSIAFWSYKNFTTWPSYRELPNRSFIQVAKFLIDDNISKRPYAQVSLWEVSGIKIEGCSFLNDMSPERRAALGGSNGGDGIVSDGANYLVTDYCPGTMLGVPCTDATIIPSHIRGFFRGVFAYNSVLDRNFTVTKTFFEKNAYGIYTAAVNAVAIQKDSFKIEDPTTLVRRPIGYRNLASTWFQVQFNKFAPISYTKGFSPAFPDRPYYIYPENTIGALVEESGSDMNRIDGNRYDFLMAGNYSQGCNTNGEKPLDLDNKGLEFLCNDYGFVTLAQYMDGADRTTDGMRCIQGRTNSPAGNRFIISTTPETISIDRYLHYWGYIDAGSGLPNVLPVNKYYYSTLSISTEMPTRYETSLITIVGRNEPAFCVQPAPEGSGPVVSPTVGGIGATTTFVALTSALEDSTEYRTSLLHTAYDNMNSPYADLSRTLLYYQAGNIQSGNALYDAIATNYPDLTTKEAYEFQIGKSLMKVYANHYQNNISMDSLTNAEIDTLEYVRDNGKMWAKTRACNWLLRVTKQECAIGEVYLPEDSTQITYRLAENAANWCRISPNPTEDNFTVNYQLLGSADDGSLIVTDLSGRKIYTSQLLKSEKNSLIPAQNWPVGLYIYTISQSGKTLYHGKLFKK